jgi:hypothetical protein
MFYQTTVLAVRMGTPKAVSTIADWAAQAPYRGKYLACWQSEIGVLGQVMLLHGYDDLAAMLEDRETVAQAPERYGIGDGLANVSIMTGKPFPMFSAPLQPGEYGPIFEVRAYLLRVGALEEFIQRWERSLPARMALSKPLLIMHSLEGAGPKVTHIWPYASLEARDRIRNQAAEQGVWPIKGPPGTVVAQQSEIFIPGPHSPIS